MLLCYFFSLALVELGYSSWNLVSHHIPYSSDGLDAADHLIVDFNEAYLFENKRVHLYLFEYQLVAPLSEWSYQKIHNLSCL